MADEQLNQAKMQKNKMPVNKSNKLVNTPVKENKKEELKKEELKHEHSHDEHDHSHEHKHETPKTESEKKETEDKPLEKVSKTEEPKKEVKKVEKKVVKTEAIINGKRLPISLKDSIAIGNFIKNKSIEDAIADLQMVLKKKKAVPIKGEFPHRKGKGMMSGKFPINASSHFITLLKSLSSNCTNNGMDLDKTRIVSVIPNKAPQQLHRFGSTKFKRTHVTIISKQMNLLEKGSPKRQMNNIKIGGKK